MGKKRKEGFNLKFPEPESMSEPRSLYIYEGLTLDEIAARFKGRPGYSKGTLARRSSSERWPELRRQHLCNLHRATEAKVREATGTAALANPETSDPVIDPVAHEPGQRRSGKVAQGLELVADVALLAAHDARKVLLADRIRIVSTVDGEESVMEMKNTLREKEVAMRMNSSAHDSLRKLRADEQSDAMDGELRRLQREKLAAEVELLRQNIKRGQGNTPGMLDDDEASVEELHERITALLAGSPPKKPSA